MRRVKKAEESDHTNGGDVLERVSGGKNARRIGLARRKREKKIKVLVRRKKQPLVEGFHWQRVKGKPGPSRVSGEVVSWGRS